jgi:hypothetical protein
MPDTGPVSGDVVLSIDEGFRSPNGHNLVHINRARNMVRGEGNKGIPVENQMSRERLEL